LSFSGLYKGGRLDFIYCYSQEEAHGSICLPKHNMRTRMCFYWHRVLFASHLKIVDQKKPMMMNRDIRS